MLPIICHFCNNKMNVITKYLHDCKNHENFLVIFYSNLNTLELSNYEYSFFFNYDSNSITLWYHNTIIHKSINSINIHPDNFYPVINKIIKLNPLS